MALPTMITVETLQETLNQSDVVVLDCRFYLTDHGKGYQEYLLGHIPGAIFVDLHTELAGKESDTSGRHPLPSEQVLANSIQNWGIDTHTQVIVYDDMGGAIAARAWWMLVQQGIEVYVLDGGFPAWTASALSIETQEHKAVIAKEKIEVSYPWFISEENVAENLVSEQFQLVDSRDNARFQGLNETMDPVAGHIPGALNRPFTDNLTDAGTMKSPLLLAKEWGALLGEIEIPIVYYCGSGVTACHNILAMNHAGLEAKHVYIGSWSQWAKRIQRSMSESNE